MIVASHPNKDDLSARKLLVKGSASSELYNALKEINIPENKCWITTMVKYGIGNKDKPTSEQIEECAPYLDAEIEMVKPDLIVALGAEAFKRIMKQNVKISKYMGEIVDCPYGKVLPNYSLGHVFNVDPKLRPELKDIFFLARRYVLNQLHYKEFKYLIVRDPEVNKKILQSYIDAGAWTIGYDMEWKGKFMKDEVPYTFQYSCEPHKAIILPLVEQNPDGSLTPVNMELLNSMKMFMENPKADRVGWNIRADDKRLVQLGFTIPDESIGFDGMKAVAFFDSRWKKSLDVGIKRFTDYAPYYNALTEALTKHKLDYSCLADLMFLEPDVFFKYCGGDAVSHYTACVEMRRQMSEFPEQGVVKYYHDVYLPMSHYFLDMESTGLPIDLDLMEDITNKYVACYNTLAKKLNDYLKSFGFNSEEYEKIVAEHGEEKAREAGVYEDFNPRSYLHKRILFFELLKLEPAYYGRKGKTKPKAWYDKQKPHTQVLWNPSTNGKSMASIRYGLAEKLKETPDDPDLNFKFDVVKTYLDLARISVFSHKFLAKKGTDYEPSIFDNDEDEEDGSHDIGYVRPTVRADKEVPLKSSYWNALGNDGRIHADFYECLDNFRSSSKPNVQNPASKVLSHIPGIFTGAGFTEADVPKNIRNIFYAGDKDWHFAEVDVAGADLAIAAFLSEDPDYIMDIRKGGFHVTKMREYFSNPALTKDEASKYVTAKSITFRVAYTAGLMSAAIPIQAEIYAENGNLVDINLINYALKTWERYGVYMDYRDQCQKQVEIYKWIENARGMRFYFEETDNFAIKAGWMNQSLAYPIASELALFLWDVSVQIKAQMKRDGTWMKWCKPVNSVHDASYWIIHKDLMKDMYFPELCKEYFTNKVKIATGDNLGMEMVVSDRWKGKSKIFEGETAWDFKNGLWVWKK